MNGEELNEKMKSIGLTASGLNGLEDAIIGYQVTPPDEHAEAEDTGLDQDLKPVRLIYDYDGIIFLVEEAMEQPHKPEDVVAYVENNIVKALQEVPLKERPIIVRSIN